MGKEFNCIVYLSPFTRCVVLYQLENVAPLSAQQNQWHDPLQGVAKLPQTQLPRIDEYKWDSFSSLHAPLAEGLLKCRKVEWNLVACEHMCFEHFPIFLWDHGNCLYQCPSLPLGVWFGQTSNQKTYGTNLAVDCKQKVYIESYMLLPQEYANCHGNGNNDKKHQMSGKV